MRGIARERRDAARVWQRRRREQQKVVEVRRLAAGLGHDINNLLMVVLAATDVVRDRAASPDELVRAAADIEDAALRSAAIARQLLAIGRPTAHGSGPIHTRDVVPVCAADELRRLEPTLCRAVGPDVRVAMTITSELPTIVDGGQLGQAVLNLAVNARDAMPDGGAIRIDARDVVVDHRGTTERTPLPGRYVAIAVEDTGIGMDDETRARAREPFFTTKPGTGTGLGLAMVDDLVRRCGGYVDIRSRRGKGTTVTLYLPAFVMRAS